MFAWGSIWAFMKAYIAPVSLANANAFVEAHHRHHKKVVGHKFSIGLYLGDALRGVAIVGRPVSRHRDDGFTLEVNRCCTDGIDNGCSMLYGAARRAAFAMGYRKLITYTLADESGSSLNGAGWKCLGERRGGSWSVPSRPRVDKHPTGTKTLWEVASCLTA
jgi:hypothetical protein